MDSTPLPTSDKFQRKSKVIGDDVRWIQQLVRGLIDIPGGEVKGTVIKCIQEMVNAKFGALKWKEIRKNAGMPDTRTFQMIEDVPDAELMTLLQSVSKTAGLTMDATMEAFGEYWSTVWAPDVYEPYFAKATSARELLLNLDHIHDRITKTMKSAAPPRFRYEWKTEKHLVMHYSSNRGLVVLMPGLIRGVAKRYKEKIVVSLKGNAIEIVFA